MRGVWSTHLIGRTHFHDAQTRRQSQNPPLQIGAVQISERIVVGVELTRCCCRTALASRRIRLTLNDCPSAFACGPGPPRTDVLGHFQPSLRDWSRLLSLPRTSSWATLSRPYGTGARAALIADLPLASAVHASRSTKAIWTSLTSKIFRHSGMTVAFKAAFEVFARVGPDNSLERLTERSVGLVTDRSGNVYELFVTLFE
jgi:hypothetical protein